MTVGNYTQSSEFVDNIDNSLDLMASIIEGIRDKLKAL